MEKTIDPKDRLPEPEGHIFDIISSIDRGSVVFDLEDALKTMIEAVYDTQKSGRVTLDLAFAYDSSTEAMRVSGKVKKTMPQKQSKASLFFLTPGGNLSRVDHRQRDMFISK